MAAAHLRLSCAIWGHAVDNDTFRRSAQPGRQCRCGTQYLREDGTLTHVRHTLSCFLRHHTYVRLADRDGAHEYVCVRCGHPLVYPAGTDPFTDRELFTKKVRYRCGLFGHRVQAIAARDGFTEYACGCGHSFLKRLADEQKPRTSAASEPRERSGDHGVPASERVGGGGGAKPPDLKKIRHPLLCFFRAHRVRFLARRCGYAEYVCDDCGQPYCFADARG